ncbi:MAG: DUF5114 domain-containing protein [Bacteroidales bacterium]|nr:DUF5114 domain-containing protein [Bacteroidales bacterium]MCD8394380.1 DUF5114 domain-containing protein [Bacteroidales bacterium]
MKLTKYIAAACLISATALLSSCDKDGDIIYTSGGDNVTLNGSLDDIVLDKDNLGNLALTLYWNDNGTISTSDVRVAAPKNAITNSIQLAADPEFTNVVEITMSDGVYEKQFTHGDLNSYCTRIGLEGGVKAPIYIRIKSVLGANIDPTYSNVLSMNVTPYYIDMTIGYYLDSSMNDTGRVLYSPNSDGIYYGFIGAASWENWWLQEGNGVLWGNYGEDGHVFTISSDDSHWNMWYPEPSGCYYTIVNTQLLNWSALLINDLTVSGDITGAMEYDRKSNVWTLTFNNTSTGSKTIKIEGNAVQYNTTTGTDNSAAIATQVSFSGSADGLTFAQSAASGSITVNTSATGTVTLKLDLNDPHAWTAAVEEGGHEVVTVSHYLWISGIDDGISGSWTFDNYLILYNEDQLGYGGAADCNSLWGWQFYTEEGDWSTSIGMADGGNAYEGSLLKGGANITAPTPGQYVIEASLSGMSYKLHKINTVSYAGLNDDWTMQPMTQVSGCTYQATVTKSANTPWGVKILINDSWDLYFGGGSGELLLYNEGFDGDNDLPNGTYTLTVDLNKGTYSYQ